MHKETKKVAVDDSEKWVRLASTKMYSANWKQRYESWRQKLLADPSKQPYAAQQMILDVIHDRCVLEHDIETNEDSVEAAKLTAAREPLLRLIHGLPGL